MEGMRLATHRGMRQLYPLAAALCGGSLIACAGAAQGPGGETVIAPDADGAYDTTTWSHPSTGGETEVRIPSFAIATCDVPTPHFGVGAVELRNKAEYALDALARCVTEGALPGATLTLVGHEPHSQRRAAEIARYLVERGVPEAQIITRGGGDVPVDGIITVGWPQDRRVDIRIDAPAE